MFSTAFFSRNTAGLPRCQRIEMWPPGQLHKHRVLTVPSLASLPRAHESHPGAKFLVISWVTWPRARPCFSSARSPEDQKITEKCTACPLFTPSGTTIVLQ